MTDVFDAAALLKQQVPSADDKVDRHDPPQTSKPVNDNPPGDSNSVTTQNVGRTERRPTKGEGDRAFGSTTERPADLRSDQSEKDIRQEVSDRVSRLNSQKDNQSTDSRN